MNEGIHPPPIPRYSPNDVHRFFITDKHKFRFKETSVGLKKASMHLKVFMVMLSMFLLFVILFITW